MNKKSKYIIILIPFLAIFFTIFIYFYWNFNSLDYSNIDDKLYVNIYDKDWNIDKNLYLLDLSQLRKKDNKLLLSKIDWNSIPFNNGSRLNESNGKYKIIDGNIYLGSKKISEIQVDNGHGYYWLKNDTMLISFAIPNPKDIIKKSLIIDLKSWKYQWSDIQIENWKSVSVSSISWYE